MVMILCVVVVCTHVFCCLGVWWGAIMRRSCSCVWCGAVLVMHGGILSYGVVWYRFKLCDVLVVLYGVVRVTLCLGRNFVWCLVCGGMV